MSKDDKGSRGDHNPAIILAYGNHVTGLGLIRGLGEKNIDTYLVDKNKYNLGKYSKYCTDFIKVSENDFENIFELVDNITKKYELEKPVLFPTNDFQSFLLSKNKEKLEKNYFVASPDWEVTSVCYNKIHTHRAVEDIGIPSPRSYFIRDGLTIKEINERIEYPVIIKPGIMHKFLEKTGEKAFKVNNQKELKTKFKKASTIMDPNDLIIQEIIPGGPENLYSYGSLYHDQKEIVYLIKKSIRQLPMDFGVSTYLERTDSRKVHEMSEKILHHIGYEGITEVEFKRDPRDGVFKFFEINPRPWKWHSLFLAYGINLPYLYYRSVLGKELNVDIKGEMDDIKWVDTYPDLLISFKEIMKGNLKIREYFGTLKEKKAHSIYQKDDIMPFIMETVLLPYFLLKKKLG